MSIGLYLLVGIFLPLFPFSVLFNWAFQRLPNTFLRAAALLIWPQIGLGILAVSEAELPSWLMLWAAATALFYGFRLLAVRELGVWTGFLATSSWALFWFVAVGSNDASSGPVTALLFSVPLVLLVVISAFLERRFGAAYAGIPGGLADAAPRLSGILVAVVLAATATPVFPGFFVMLDAVVSTMPRLPLVAVIAAAVWMLWSWAGARLLQGFIAGQSSSSDVKDLGTLPMWFVVGTLTLLTFSSLFLIGVRS